MTSEALTLSTSGGDLISGNDDSLVRRAQAGDRRAFDLLMQHYERRVWGLARRLLGESDEIADVAQQAFLRLYRQLQRLDSRRPLWPYLCRIVANLCRDTARRPRLKVALEEMSQQDEPMSPDPTPREKALAAERTRLLRRCLDSLPPAERQAIVLRDLEGFTTREVAEILGSTPTTVRSQISRGRLRLRDRLHELEWKERDENAL